MKRTDIQWQVYYYPAGSSRLKYYATYETREKARERANMLMHAVDCQKVVVLRYVRGE